MLSQNLNNVILDYSKTLRKKLGFGYVPDVMAPSSFRELCLAFERSKDTSIPLPVYSGGSSNTIYGNEEVNFAFRFWHDVEHVLGNNSFSLKGEIATAYRQLSVLESEYGLKPSSIEWKLLYADVIGQIEYYYENRRFVINQVDYVQAYLLKM